MQRTNINSFLGRTSVFDFKRETVQSLTSILISDFTYDFFNGIILLRINNDQRLYLSSIHN